MSNSSNPRDHADRGHDLFIVHANGDRALGRRLSEADARGRARPGRHPARLRPDGALVDEFVRSTQESRFTALVLSPAFLADDWAAFGQQLSTFAAVEEGGCRFVILTLHECELPLQLRYRVSLDCTNWEEWDDRVARLASSSTPPTRCRRRSRARTPAWSPSGPRTRHSSSAATTRSTT